jgi:hypothetical protein
LNKENFVKTYIRFENGRQVEVTTLAAKPAGNDWKTVPKNFDFAKRYRLSDSGSVEEIPEAELAAANLEIEKTLALQELTRLVENARSKYVGVSPSKRKSYELQEKAANAVLANVESVLGAVIQPLAAIRNISILGMAELILSKANVANQKVAEAEAIEDEFKKLITNAENPGAIGDLMVDILNRLEDF